MSGRIIGLSVRVSEDRPAEERESLALDPEGGVLGDHGSRGKRQVTILAGESWADATGEVGAELPWTTRRANVFVEGLALGRLLEGGVLKLGETEIEIHGETHPCGLMDEAKEGLREALVPETRGGVYGRITTGGTIRVGDAAAIAKEGTRA